MYHFSLSVHEPTLNSLNLFSHPDRERFSLTDMNMDHMLLICCRVVMIGTILRTGPAWRFGIGGETVRGCTLICCGAVGGGNAVTCDD